jgi:hypothetical protein
MNTYDPADRIRYVHMTQQPVAPPAAVDAGGACDPLPAGYANLSAVTRLAGAPEIHAGTASGAAGCGSDRPALVLLPGGAAPATGVSAPPALRLA